MRTVIGRSGRGALLLGLITLVVACDDSPTEPEPFRVEDVQFAPELDVTVEDLEETESGLFYHDAVQGEGPQPVAESSSLELHLTLWLADGTLIGDSRTTEPVTLDLGDPATNLPPGLEEGLLGMNEGGVRILVVPPELGYGAEGTEVIPPNSGLVFRIELLSVGGAAAPAGTSK